MTLSGAITLGQSGPGSNGDEGVLHIPKKFSITETSPSDSLVSYAGHLLVGVVLPLCSEAVGVFYSPSRLDNRIARVHCRFYGIRMIHFFIK